MGFYTSLMRQVKKLAYLVFKRVTDKKTLLILVGALICYKIYKFPQKLNASDFLKLLNDKNSIETLSILNNNQILVDAANKARYLCNYIISDSESFYHGLIKKGISFEVYTGFASGIINPLNQIMACSMGFGGLLGSILSERKQSFSTNYKGSGIKSISKSNIFKDFIGSQKILETLSIIVDQLSNPEKYESNNIKPVKGILIYGKPGTGKTLIAKCLSQLPNISFFTACASDFVELYVGSGPKKVRELFEQARNNSPAIIFIDELEVVGMQRSSSYQTYSQNLERYSTLNQLLSELDGMNVLENIIVIGSTNREDLLDSALIRPGRLEMKLQIDLPNLEERIQLYDLYFTKLKIKSNIDFIFENGFIEAIAKKSEGFTGAVIERVVNQAATESLNGKVFNEGLIFDCIMQSRSDLELFSKYQERNSKNFYYQ